MPVPWYAHCRRTTPNMGNCLIHTCLYPGGSSWSPSRQRLCVANPMPQRWEDHPNDAERGSPELQFHIKHFGRTLPNERIQARGFANANSQTRAPTPRVAQDNSYRRISKRRLLNNQYYVNNPELTSFGWNARPNTTNERP